jgi:hypothetical protein
VKKIYLEWLTEKRESEKAKSEGTNMPEVAIANKGDTPKNEKPADSDDKGSKDRKSVAFKDALKEPEKK